MDKNAKRLFISFLIMMLSLTGCTQISGEPESDNQATSLVSEDEEDDEIEDSVPEEGTTASEYDWNEVHFNGISFWVPAEWEKDDSLGENNVLYEDTKSPDYAQFEYEINTDISSEQREDPVLLEDAVLTYDYIWIGATKGQAVMIGTRLAYKVIGTYYQDQIEYQGHVYYIPVGDFGIVRATFMHAKGGDVQSDSSCLEMMISTLKTDDGSVPDDSKDLGITDLGTLPVTLVNAEGFVVKVDSVEDTVVNISIINKSDEERTISLEDLSINGYMVEGTFNYEYSGKQRSSTNCAVEAGGEKEVELTASDLDVFGLKNIGRVGIKFYCVDSDYDEFYDSDYVLFNAFEDYVAEDYATCQISDEIVYQDDTAIITYEGIADGYAYLCVQNLKNEVIDISGNKISVDGEFYDASARATVYPGTICIMKIDNVKVSSGSSMDISFTINLNSSHYSTDNCSVNL